VRAQVIEKDRTPHWDPATLEGVSASMIASFFESTDAMSDPFPQAGL
jgi:enoyl-CoA hydratase